MLTYKQKISIQWSNLINYTYNNVHSYAPASAGVYVLEVKLTTGGTEKFYVGQANNLDRRLKEHLNDSEPNKCIKGNLKYTCYFRYTKVASQSERDKIEKALYKKFKPTCNDPDAIPNATDIDVNY